MDIQERPYQRDARRSSSLLMLEEKLADPSPVEILEVFDPRSAIPLELARRDLDWMLGKVLLPELIPDGLFYLPDAVLRTTRPFGRLNLGDLRVAMHCCAKNREEGEFAAALGIHYSGLEEEAPRVVDLKMVIHIAGDQIVVDRDRPLCATESVTDESYSAAKHYGRSRQRRYFFDAINWGSNTLTDWEVALLGRGEDELHELGFKILPELKSSRKYDRIAYPAIYRSVLPHVPEPLQHGKLVRVFPPWERRVGDERVVILPFCFFGHTHKDAFTRALPEEPMFDGSGMVVLYGYGDDTPYLRTIFLSTEIFGAQAKTLALFPETPEEWSKLRGSPTEAFHAISTLFKEKR